MALPMLDPQLHAALHRGVVIPAHPLALTAERRFDERHQRALSLYYLASGVGGLAVGVHTTQFAIREPRFGLYRPVLELAAETVREAVGPGGGAEGGPIVMVAGAIGQTPQAAAEASLARDLGYHAVLLQLGALRDVPEDDVVAHCQRVAEVLPIFGFYLQPGIGGRVLSRDFWQRFAAIPNVVAIKIACFDRYQTLDVLLGVARSGRGREVALYTGNDDAIVADLLFRFQTSDERGVAASVRIVGGLLGHWAVWTSRAVEMLAAIRALDASGAPAPLEVMDRAIRTTDANAALFDPVHGYRGCIPGVHEVLRRQGLLAGRWTLDENEDLSPGQAEEIDRVTAAYPELVDDAFVAAHLDEWLR